jgi:hypothetical protein
MLLPDCFIELPEQKRAALLFLFARASAGGIYMSIKGARGRPPAGQEAWNLKDGEGVRLEIDRPEGWERWYLSLLEVAHDGSVYADAPSPFVPKSEVDSDVAILPTARPEYICHANPPGRYWYLAVLTKAKLEIPWEFRAEDLWSPEVSPEMLAKLVAQLKALPADDVAVQCMKYLVNW